VGLNKGGVMKGYLFGLGAMLFGAGLMFVLMHGEVNAEGRHSFYLNIRAIIISQIN